MKFTAAIDTDLMAEPSETSAVIMSLFPGQALGEGIVTADEKWVEVKVGGKKGFVLTSACKEGTGPDLGFDPAGVVQRCVIAESNFNADDKIAPWYILADFLIARAIIETGIKNLGPIVPGSDGVGPMQVST